MPALLNGPPVCCVTSQGGQLRLQISIMGVRGGPSTDGRALGSGVTFLWWVRSRVRGGAWLVTGKGVGLLHLAVY